MKTAILTIGDELLNGQTTDTNSVWLGRELNNIGVSVVMRLSVGDERTEILAGLDVVFSSAPIVIVTGGLGPTKDDITKRVLAEYFENELVFHQPTYDRIADYFRMSGRQPTEAHRLQCFMPSKALLLTNNRGTAPGMWMEKNEKILLSVPGVPSEMEGIFLEQGLEKIAMLNTEHHILHYVIQTAGQGETYIAEKIADILDDFPTELSMAYLPGLASVKLRLTGKGRDEHFIKDRVEHFGQLISTRLGSAVFGIGNVQIEEVIGQLAIKRGIMIGTAESCTGGHIAHLITSISGSSAYFKGAIIAYANETKQNLLGLKVTTLENHGAVSETTVIEMVSGCLKTLSVDVAIAVSGIAGPTGGTPEKPVGTIWIAVGDENRCVTRKIRLNKNRLLNIQYTSVVALNQLRLFLE